MNPEQIMKQQLANQAVQIENILKRLGEVDVSKRLDNMFNSLKLISCNIQDIFDKLENLEKRVSLFKNETTDKLGVLSEGFKVVESETKYHKDRLDQIALKLHELQGKFQSHKNVYEIEYKKSESFKETLDNYIKNQNVSVDKKLEDFCREVTNKITNIKIPEIPTQVDVKPMIEEKFFPLAKKFQDISLDLENAILKSNNSEMQIKLFEKKLENIYLLIKKFELKE